MANTPYLLYTTQAAGPSLTAGTAASLLTTATPAAGQVRNTIPAGWLNTVGATITADLSGTLITAATPGTGTFSLYFGTTAIWNSNAVTLPVSMATDPWCVHLEFRIATVGASTAGTIYGNGYGIFSGASKAAATTFAFTDAAGVAGFDTTVPNVLDFYFTESLSTATMILQQARAVIWNPNW